MNYTEKYHLPQWEENDRIMRTDFNNAMAALEDGLSSNAQGVREAKTEAAKLPYVVGTYVGTVEAQEVHLGFRPSVLIVFVTSDSNTESATKNFFFAVTKDSPTAKVSFTNSGFHLSKEDGAYRFPMANSANVHYQFVAFR